MAKDKVVRTSYRRKPGFLEKLGNNAAGAAGGFTLFLISFYILYSNESRSVETEAVLEEAQQRVVSVDDIVDLTMNNGMLIHVSGPLEAEILGDPIYPVALPCVRFSRHVEMYQWVEHSEVHEYEERNEIRKETEYTYDAEWSHIVHKSKDFAEEFGHQNPSEMPVKPFQTTASDVKVKGYKLSNSAIQKINWNVDLDKLPEPIESLDVELHEKYYYHARDPYSPDIGDCRVYFQCSGIAGDSKAGPVDQVTILAKNTNGILSPYQIRSTRLEFVHRGIKSPEEVINSEKRSNKLLTWGLRLGGWVLMYLGLSIMTKIVKTLVGWIPVLGSIISASVTMFNITLSLSLSLITIAIGWLRARPIFSFAIGAASMIPWIVSRTKVGVAASYKAR